MSESKTLVEIYDKRNALVREFSLKTNSGAHSFCLLLTCQVRNLYLTSRGSQHYCHEIFLLCRFLASYRHTPND